MILPGRSRMKRRLVSPGGEVTAIGCAQVTGGKALVVRKVGGPPGKVTVVFATRPVSPNGCAATPEIVSRKQTTPQKPNADFMMQILPSAGQNVKTPGTGNPPQVSVPCDSDEKLAPDAKRANGVVTGPSDKGGDG
jgi:hypothetical protein